MRRILFLLVFLYLPASASTTVDTVGSRTALRFEPYEFGIGETFAKMDQVCSDKGYAVTRRRQSSASDNPTVGLGSISSNLSGYSVLGWAAHASDKGIAAEVYTTASARDFGYNFAIGHGWTAEEIYPASSVDGFHISMRATAISSRFGSVHTLVYVRGCDCMGVVNAGFATARWRGSYSGTCTTGAADATTFFTSWGNGNTATESISGTSLTPNGNGETVIDIYIKSQPNFLANVPPGGKEFVWEFSSYATGSLVGDATIQVVSQSWSSDNITLTATLAPVSTGIGYVTGNITSGTGMPLSGFNSWGFNHGHNPAASVNGFSVIDEANGSRFAYWQVDSEYQTEGYKIQSSQSPDGPRQDIGILQPAGQIQYQVDISNELGNYFHLIEIEVDGSHEHLASTEPSVRYPKENQVSPSSEYYQGRIATYQAELEKQRAQLALMDVGVGTKVTYFSIPEVYEAVDFGLASLWRDRFGYDVEVVSTNDWPNNPQEHVNRMMSEIRDRYNNEGVRFFMLVGGANAWQQSRFDQSTPPPLYQTNGWDTVWYGYKGNGYNDQSSRDRMPTIYREATESRSVNGAWYVPFWYSDWFFVDFDGDENPDAVITRLPFNDPSHIWSFADKMWQSQNYGVWEIPDEVAMMVGDYGIGGSFAASTAQVLESYLPPSTNIHRLLQSEIISDAIRNDAAADLINNYQPKMYIGVAGKSSRSWPFRNFDQTVISNPWTMSKLYPTNVFSVVLGISCGTGDFARTWHPDYGSPIWHKFLSHQYGSLAWMGSVEGTWTDGSQIDDPDYANAVEIVSSYILSALYADAHRPMAESMLVGIQNVLRDHGDKPHVRYVALSTTFLGDPLSRMSRPMIATSVSPENNPHQTSLSLSNSPNPFNASTRIYYTLAETGPIEISIYNEAGRLVKTLVSETKQAGPQHIDWRGDDNNGQIVASGVYHYSLRTKNSIISKKLTLLK